MAIDAIDVKILNVLQDNARASISELSKACGLSLSAVSERLKKLETSGVIDKYTAIINSEAMGKDLMAIVMVQVTGCGGGQETLDFITNEPEILSCHKITGVYDYVLIITTHNTASLEAFMNRLRSNPCYKASETNIILNTFKHLYSVQPVINK